jgi:hypothetical protein
VEKVKETRSIQETGPTCNYWPIQIIFRHRSSLAEFREIIEKNLVKSPHSREFKN